MSDDIQAPAEADTPAIAAEPTPEAAAEHSTDWEKRYKDLQSSVTPLQQELSQLKQGEAQQLYAALTSEETSAATLQSIASQLGYTLSELEAELEDTPEFQDPRVDSLIAERAQEKQEAHLAQIETRFGGEIEQLAKDNKIDLDPEAKDLLFAAAVARPLLEDGSLDAKGAFEKLTGLRNTWLKGYTQGKKDSPAPPLSGSSATPSAPLGGSPKDRRKLALEIANRSYGSAS